MEKILILPIGKADEEILTYLKAELEKEFSQSVEIDRPLAEPDYAYHSGRRQYQATLILREIAKIKLNSGKRILAIIDRNLYSPNFNFVFGQALIEEKIALTSLTRLRPEYYGLPENKNLFRERVIKEAIHELGHTFWLPHCQNPNCVMYFSNQLRDTDRKSSSFCPSCQIVLRKRKGGTDARIR